MAKSRAAALLILIMVHLPCSHADSLTCSLKRQAASVPGVPACDKQMTCIPRDKIAILKERNLFPRYADSMKPFENKICENENRRSQFAELYKLAPQLKFPGDLDLRETEMAVNFVNKVKSKVDNALSKSRSRINWVNDCVGALAKNESYFPDGSFNPAKTTENFKSTQGKTHESCAALWDSRAAKLPIVNALQEELMNSRLYLALGNNWGAPDQGGMNISIPPLKGEFFKDIPESIEPLNPLEKSKIVETRDRLFRECIVANKSECTSIPALQEYAKKRYQQTLNESPILAYFSRSVDPKRPIRGTEIASAYKRHQAKMNNLIDVKLADQDYLQFSYFVDETIGEMPEQERGDYCEVIGGMLANVKAKENFDTGILLVGAAYGGMGALAAKGIVGRSLAFLAGSSYSTDLYMLGQVATHYEVMKKVDATCSQAHLRMPGVCNVETLRSNSQSVITDGVGLGISGLMSGLSLYGPARRMIVEGLMPSR